MINIRKDFYPAMIGFALASLITYGVYLWNATPEVDLVQRTVSTNDVRAGDLAMVTWKEERSNNCRATVSRRLIAADNSIVDFEPIEKPMHPSNEAFVDSFSFKVPVGLKNGPLVFRASVEFRCNWVQRLVGGHRETLPDIVFNYTNGGTVSQ